jgi:selenocysteine lyase/cysteine desulfurase
MKLISDFCKRNKLFLIVDCISSFLADPFDMEELEADVMIAGSQKALACPPGIAVMCFSQKALELIIFIIWYMLLFPRIYFPFLQCGLNSYPNEFG